MASSSFNPVVLEKTFENLLDCKEIKPVNRKGNQSSIFTGRTDAEVEIPILWPPYAKNWLIRKDPDAGKDWRQEEKGDGITDSMDMSLSELRELVMEQGGQACCSPWVKRSQTWLSDWTELKLFLSISVYLLFIHTIEPLWPEWPCFLHHPRPAFFLLCLLWFPTSCSILVSQDTGKEEFVHFRSLGSWEQWPLGCLVKHMRSSLHFLLGSQDGFWK